jgi:hypothetical protein
LSRVLSRKYKRVDTYIGSNPLFDSNFYINFIITPFSDNLWNLSTSYIINTNILSSIEGNNGFQLNYTVNGLSVNAGTTYTDWSYCMVSVLEPSKI